MRKHEITEAQGNLRDRKRTVVLEDVAETIHVCGGEAKYLHTEVENSEGEWHDDYKTIDGEYVIHDCIFHHVYTATKKVDNEPCGENKWAVIEQENSRKANLNKLEESV